MNSLVGSLLPPAERPFGNYELVAKIATGGMAEIFLARRNSSDDQGEPDEQEDGEKLPELVVIKRVLPHLLEESRFIAMFRDEARLASQIVHPNVCRVFDSGRVQGTYFIAMEYLHGVPLSRMLLRAARTKQHVSIPLVVGILIQCCNGLHHAHELRSRDGRPLDVVHRDVSPPNIFVTTDGLAKMLDFGVAKARGASQKTRTGTVKGKNSYMSPEQILGQEVDRRSDVFSLGIVLWEALTSKRLFSRDTDFLTFTAITKTEIPDVRETRSDISDELAGVVNRALAQDREDRHDTAKDLSLALWQTSAGDGEYASEIGIGEYVRQSFSKELISKDDLSKSLSQQLAAVSDPTEGGEESSVRGALDEESSGEGAPASHDTARIARLKKNTPHNPTNTQMLLVNQSGERQRLVLAVVTAAVVTAFLAAIVFRGSDSESVNVAYDAAIETVAPDAPIDASVVIMATPVDAAVPDAAPVIPEVDRRPAYLTVDSSPYATIFVDGKKLGVTPIFKAKLKPGPHKLKAVSATGAKQNLRLNLKPGRTKNLGRLKW